jgi:hypothetical protein
MEFEFDPAKSEANLAKHGIDFSAAQTLWSGPVLEVPALTSDEPRKVVIGKIGGKHWAAVITVRAGRNTNHLRAPGARPRANTI